MFKLIFGVIWTLFVTPIFIMCLTVPGDVRGGVDMTPGLFLFLLLFEVIGIILIASGLKKVIKDKKTSKLGEVTYGQILSIYGTGSMINDKEELQAEVLTCLPNVQAVSKYNEIIGFPPVDYNVGDFVELKIHECDINIIRRVQENELPGKTLEAIKEEIKKEDTIIVNGEVYIKQETNDNN